MSRYIDAEYNLRDLYCYFDFSDEELTAISTVLKLIPRADVVEVKHGRWIDYKCSVCGFEPYDPSGMEIFNYCSNCGADMRGGSNDGR